jgi:hypothetical protein
MTQQMVTANRLTDGAVVFLAEGGQWVESVGQGRLADDEAAAAALLQAGEAAVARAEVVGPYLIEIAIQDDGRPVPTRYRERIRADGPSVRGDVGKPAEAR